MRVVIKCLVMPLLLATSCANGPERGHGREEDVRELFARIELGSHRSEVERALGRPVLETAERDGQGPLGRIRAYYLEPPPLPNEMSPFMPGAIGVVYVQDHVVEKSLNPQVRR